MANPKYENTTAVLVHAAWADASSWNKVAMELHKLGFRVRSAQIPLTSLADDVVVTRRLLQRVDGPVLLAGHSYAGAVISAAATGHPAVKALIFVSAIVPDEGETVGDLFQNAEPVSGLRPRIAPDGDGFLWLPPGAVENALAPDAHVEEKVLMDIGQHPIALKCLQEPMTAPAWKQKPSWFLIAEKDRMISPEKQHAMATRIGARIHSYDVDHNPLLSAPKSVVRVIVEAADGSV